MRRQPPCALGRYSKCHSRAAMQSRPSAGSSRYRSGPGGSPHSFRGLFKRAYAALRPDGVLIFDVFVKGRRMKYKTWRLGATWAVLAHVNEEPVRRRLTRDIVTFRKTGQGYRRRAERHVLTVSMPSAVTAELRRAGFSVRSTRAYMAVFDYRIGAWAWSPGSRSRDSMPLPPNVGAQAEPPCSAMDLQAGIVSIYVKRPEFIGRAANVLKLARAAGLLVVHVRVGSGRGFPKSFAQLAASAPVKASPQHQKLFEAPVGRSIKQSRREGRRGRDHEAPGQRVCWNGAGPHSASA